MKLITMVQTFDDELQTEWDQLYEKITDINTIMGFGIMMTPGLAVDGRVKVSGKVPDVAEIKKLLA